MSFSSVMVGVARRLRLEPVDGAAEKTVGVGDGIVVGVDQLAVAAVGQQVDSALGHKALYVGRRSLVIGRAVAGHLVHEQQHALGTSLRCQRLDATVEADEQGVVEAPVVAAQRGLGGGFQLDAGVRVGHPVAHVLAATGLVVEPQHGQTGGRKHLNSACYQSLSVMSKQGNFVHCQDW